jgi:hypothetical protein
MSQLEEKAAKRARLLDQHDMDAVPSGEGVEGNATVGPDGTVLEGSGERNEDVDIAKQHRGKRVDEDSF